jgi:hypothetical protein
MSTAVPYPAQLGFEGGLHIARWRPLVQWLLAILQLLIAAALGQLRSVLTLMSSRSSLPSRSPFALRRDRQDVPLGVARDQLCLVPSRGLSTLRFTTRSQR